MVDSAFWALSSLKLYIIIYIYIHIYIYRWSESDLGRSPRDFMWGPSVVGVRIRGFVGPGRGKFSGNREAQGTKSIGVVVKIRVPFWVP